jgi:hypothetical protein
VVGRGGVGRHKSCNSITLHCVTGHSAFVLPLVLTNIMHVAGREGGCVGDNSIFAPQTCYIFPGYNSALVLPLVFAQLHIRQPGGQAALGHGHNRESL